MRDGVEDLTGGVTTRIYTNDILSKDRLWEESLTKINDEFLFGCGSHTMKDPNNEGRDGIYGDHAYSILRAESYGNERLLMIMNPWGRAEWNGPWSDASSQWTAEAIKDLGHVFGDDGVFWIRFEDFLRKFEIIYRTRLFAPDWSVAQQWINVVVPWAGHYQNTRFEVAIAQAGPAVFVLSQLDDRYFRGLEGQYIFLISFQLFRSDQQDYIISSDGEDKSNRSVSVELDLETGTYEVRLKVSAIRNKEADKVEDVVKSNWLGRREKLLRIGLSYHLAHAKAQFDDAKEKLVEGSQSSWPQVVKRVLGNDDDPKYEEKKDQTESQGRSNDTTNPQKETPSKHEPLEEPWNATCVVGLRVYTKVSHATIKVAGSKKDRGTNRKKSVVEYEQSDESHENATFSIRSVT